MGGRKYKKKKLFSDTDQKLFKTEGQKGLFVSGIPLLGIYTKETLAIQK